MLYTVIVITYCARGIGNNIMVEEYSQLYTMCTYWLLNGKRRDLFLFRSWPVMTAGPGLYLETKRYALFTTLEKNRIKRMIFKTNICILRFRSIVIDQSLVRRSCACRLFHGCKQVKV